MGKSRQRKRTDEVRLEWSERHASSSKFCSSILSLKKKIKIKELKIKVGLFEICEREREKLLYKILYS